MVAQHAAVWKAKVHAFQSRLVNLNDAVGRAQQAADILIAPADTVIKNSNCTFVKYIHDDLYV